MPIAAIAEDLEERTLVVLAYFIVAFSSVSLVDWISLVRF